MTTELKDLMKDARLARLFSMPGRACALQIWIAQIQTDDGLENRFVYGRLLPYSFSLGGWSASSDDKFEAVGDWRAQVIRATLYIDSDHAGELLGKLSKGDNIKEISSSLDLKLSDSLERRIGTFSFSDSYVCRPAALLLNRDAHEHLGPQSPHGSASAFSAAITTVDKEQLFTTARGLDQEMARFLVKRMNADTGLDFSSKDAARFGDLELLVFPTLDDHERELLDVSWADGCKALVVKLNLTQLPSFSKFFVHAQIMNDAQRIFSSIASVDKGATDVIECTFELPDGYWDIADSVEIEIHGVKDGAVAATSCCTWKNHYIREISISGHTLGSLNAEVKLGWLDNALKKKLRGSPRVKAAQTANRGHGGFASVIGGRKADPWVVANRKINELISVLHPPKSEARFFGRLSEGDGTERLQFVEWIKQQFAKHRDHQIIFFDPYFEDAGIGLFFPNASDKGEYVVFTTTLPTTPSIQSQKSFTGPDPDSNRIDNLLASCKQLQGLAQRIDLKIFGVKPGALHDRYMLIADRRGLPVAGFNLSNSIQKANEDHPLLITPIPMDSLHEVFKYATRLITRAANGASADGEYIEPIFDSKRQEQPVRKRNERLSFLSWDMTGSVLSTWIGDNSLRGIHGEELRTRLVELDLLDGESLRFPKTPGMDACVSGSNAMEDDSQQRWEIVAEILAHTTHGDSPWGVADDQKVAFCDFLEGSLKNAFSRISDIAPDTSFESVQSHLFQQDLESFLRGSYSYEHFRHRIKYQALTWADVFAIKILWNAAPEKLVNLSERCAVTLDREEPHRDAVKLSLLSQIVGEVSLAIAFGITNEQRESLLQSTNGLLKWMGLASLRDASKNGGAKQVVARLASFDRQTSIRTMCWLLSGLAWEEGNGEAVDIVRQALYYTLPPKLDKNEAEFLVESLRGHMRELGWSEPWLFAEVIVPLLEEERVTPEALSSTWMKELYSYLDEKLLGKTVSFDRSREGRITEVAAFLLARSSFETQGKAIDVLLKTLKKARTNVQQPLASTMNWNKWDCSLEIAMWIYAFCRHVEHHMDDSAKLPVQFVDLCQPSRDVAMVRTLDEWRYNGVQRGALAAFIEEVGNI
ncbi:VPA1262 family protein [Pseudomonas sp. O230]|uniref:VPA1262 family protein n=1 Tax=Pseudomonas sp. O230 TaxID=3159450 RepID=UPI00387B8C54